MAPDLVADFVDAFNAEMRKLATSAEYETLAAKRTLAEIERKLAAIVRAIEDGAYTDTLKARLTKLEQEKAQTEARLCAGKRAPVLRLHTNLPRSRQSIRDQQRTPRKLRKLELPLQRRSLLELRSVIGTPCPSTSRGRSGLSTRSIDSSELSAHNWPCTGVY